jgi:hypothetical protein
MRRHPTAHSDLRQRSVACVAAPSHILKAKAGAEEGDVFMMPHLTLVSTQAPYGRTSSVDEAERARGRVHAEAEAHRCNVQIRRRTDMTVVREGVAHPLVTWGKASA